MTDSKQIDDGSPLAKHTKNDYEQDPRARRPSKSEIQVLAQEGRLERAQRMERAAAARALHTAAEIEALRRPAAKDGPEFDPAELLYLEKQKLLRIWPLKPEALVIEEGASDETAAAMVARYHRDHPASWSPNKHITRARPTHYEKAMQQHRVATEAMTTQITATQVAAARALDAARPDLDRPFAEMNADEYGRAAVYLCEVHGIDLKKLTGSDLLTKEPASRPAPVFSPIEPCPAWKMRRSTMGGFDVFVPHGPFIHMSDRQVALAMLAFLSGDLGEMMSARELVNQGLPEAP